MNQWVIYLSMGNLFGLERGHRLRVKGLKKGFTFPFLLILILIAACAHAPPPRSAEDHLLLGEFLAQKGKIDGAIVEFERAIEIRADYTAAYMNLGAAYGQKGMIDQSISASKKAIELDPQNATAYYNLGNALGKGENYEEAFASFFKAIELDPGYAEPHYGLAVCYYATGHYELATEHADRAEALGFKVPPRFRRALKKALAKPG
jgi:tetratricopeptide (TPR) repeat protein